MGLAEALVLITIAMPVVLQWVSGQPVTGGDWAAVVGGVANVLITHTSGNSRMPDYGPALERIERVLGAQASNQYQDYMTAGGRLLHDLPAQWPYYQADPYNIIRDARGKFVDASTVARRMGDAYRTAQAEVAIASCWLLLQSLPEVQRTLGKARTTLEEALLNGAGHQMVRAYINVLSLCQIYGEVGPDVEIPVDPAAKATDGMLAVNACFGQWVSCLGVWVRLDSFRLGQPGCCTFVTLAVANMHWSKIKFRLGVPRTWQALLPAKPTSPVIHAPVQEDIVQRIQRWLRNDPPPPTPSTYLTRQQPATNPLPDWQILSQGSSVATTLSSPNAGKEITLKVQLPFRGVGASSGYPGITFLIP